MARLSPSEEDIYVISCLHAHVTGWFQKNWSGNWLSHGSHFESFEKIHNKSNFFEDVKEEIDKRLTQKYGLVAASKKAISTDSIRRFLLQRKMSFDDKVTEAFLALTDPGLNWSEYREKTLFAAHIPMAPAYAVASRLFTPLRVAVLIILLLLVTAGLYWQKREKTLSDFKFSATLLTPEGFPKTTRVTYDLKNIKYETARIFADNQRIDLHAAQGELTLNSSVPKKSTIKLYIDDKMAREVILAIPSDGWWGGINNKVPLTKESFMKNGIMQISASQNLDKIYGEFYTSFIYIRKFDIDADNLSLAAEVINNAEVGGIWGYDISVDILGSRGNMVFNLLSPDASQYSRLKVAETDFTEGARSYVLSRLGVKLHDWSTLEVSTKNNTFRIRLNGEVLVEESYEGKLGNLMGIQYYMKGSGAVKNVRLQPYDGKVVSL